MDWVILAIGGFLLGSFLYTGWDTTRYEPEARPGYLVIGMGIMLSVVVSTIADLKFEVADRYRFATLFSYALVAIGLALIVRERKNRRKGGDENGDDTQ